MRLDRFLCECTELSRANAKKALHRGDVTVNGEVVKNSGFKVSDSDDVRLVGERLHHQSEHYIMLNKPMDMVCSNVGEGSHESILTLLDIPKAHTLGIAGRLDADTTGLVLITSDGQWNHRVTSPNKDLGKRYRVTLESPLVEDAEQRCAEGIQLHNEKKLTKPAQLERLSDHEVLLTICEGKYHQVKRMFAALDNRVIALHREQIGAIALDADLEPGEWRELTAEEIASV
ncbi:16S rRNA pseudouridine(516) synthase RsuA [Parendozoicomonas haliclonae]|uniref:Pseudouridine synthase n=1 Tax=Parendozoicomonas haliclonae TaxID=1960125 RepID=A0A1X7AMI7_9GAMM|nr:16S rRNA pseudouridine(516) synthase RsuA [Parendozoicomonas haliclonae]SMA49213.1 Ribosomal small subunit pseudouridine synthase A [Parendozoicomonas haliclonae]